MKSRLFWYINIGYLVEFYMLFLPDNIYTVNPYGGHLGPGQMNILHIYQWYNIPIIHRQHLYKYFYVILQFL